MKKKMKKTSAVNMNEEKYIRQKWGKKVIKIENNWEWNWMKRWKREGGLTSNGIISCRRQKRGNRTWQLAESEVKFLSKLHTFIHSMGSSRYMWVVNAIQEFMALTKQKVNIHVITLHSLPALFFYFMFVFIGKCRVFLLSVLFNICWASKESTEWNNTRVEGKWVFNMQ